MIMMKIYYNETSIYAPLGITDLNTTQRKTFNGGNLKVRLWGFIYRN
jgi:hypothetical protein